MILVAFILCVVATVLLFWWWIADDNDVGMIIGIFTLIAAICFLISGCIKLHVITHADYYSAKIEQLSADNEALEEDIQNLLQNTSESSISDGILEILTEKINENNETIEKFKDKLIKIPMYKQHLYFGG